MDGTKVGYHTLESPWNATNEEECRLGVPEETRPYLIAGFCLIMVVTVSGNSIVIIVLGIVTSLKNDLNNYLLNLAVADLLVSLFCNPAKTFYVMYEDWTLGSWACSAFIAVQHTVLMVSALTLTIIGIDRYMAVKRPLQSRRNGSQSKSNIVIIWLISSSFSLIPFVTSHARESIFCGQEVTVCGDDFAAITRVEMYYQLLLLICECVIPLSILAYTYSVVCLKLWGRTLPGNADHNRDLTVTRNKKKTIKMLISIVVLFAVCLMPMQLYQLVGVSPLSSLTVNNERILFFFYYTSHWLGMVHSGINPIIYGFMNENFRADVRKWLRCSFPCVRSLKRRRVQRGGFRLQSTIRYRTSTSVFTKQNSQNSSSRVSSLTHKESSDYRTIQSVISVTGV